MKQQMRDWRRRRSERNELSSDESSEDSIGLEKWKK
jgi:hypothetical protein